MIDKLTSYAYDDITQKLDEVIDAVNGMIEPPEIGSQFHKRTKEERRISVADRRATRDGDHYIGRRCGCSLVAADAIIKELGL